MAQSNDRPRRPRPPKIELAMGDHTFTPDDNPHRPDVMRCAWCGQPKKAKSHGPCWASIKVTIEAETADEVRAIAAQIAAGGGPALSTDGIVLPKLGQRVRVDWHKTGHGGAVTRGSFTGTVSRVEDHDGRPWHFIFRHIEDPRRPTSYRSLYADEIVSWVPAA